MNIVGNLIRRLYGLKEDIEVNDDESNNYQNKSHLANLYYSQGRFDQAEELYETCLEHERTRLGEDHPQVLCLLNGTSPSRM